MLSQEPDEPSPSEIFTIDVQDLLQDFAGAHEAYSFDENVPEDTFHNFMLQSDFLLKCHVYRNERGVELRIDRLECVIDIVEDEIIGKSICLYDITREFRLELDREDTDDIEYIDTREQTINIQNVIEQEILISALI